LINATTTDSSTPDFASATTSGIRPENSGAAPAGKAFAVFGVAVCGLVVVSAVAPKERLEVAKALQKAKSGKTLIFILI
jgi:hypothetical protein